MSNTIKMACREVDDMKTESNMMKEVINQKDREKLMILGNLDLREKELEKVMDENIRLKNLV